MTVVLLSGCTGKKQSDDGTNSELEITPGISDSIFDENGGVSGVPGATVPETDTPINSEEPKFNPDDPKDCTYEEFVAMKPAQQEAVLKAYGSIEAFFEWYSKAKEEYEKDHPPIDIGDGNIDLDSILKDK